MAVGSIDSKELQRQIDLMFQKDNTSVAGVEFSLTVADPTLVECPLIGCSVGFGTLCGYTVNEIVGRNCRFLIEPVRPDLINQNFRKLCRDYIEAVRGNQAFQVPPEMQASWMPVETTRHIRRVGTLFSGVKVKTADGGLFCFQINARRNRSLFRNMFFLHTVELFAKPYILGFQCQIPNPKVLENLWGALEGSPNFYAKYQPLQTDMKPLQDACGQLTANLGKVESILLQMFTKKQKPRPPPALSAKDKRRAGVFNCCSNDDGKRSDDLGFVATKPVLDPNFASGNGVGDSVPGFGKPIAAPTAPNEGDTRVHYFGDPNELDKIRKRIGYAQLSKKKGRAPSENLWLAMDGKQTNWSRARRAARMILDPDYSLQHFTDDIVAAFPELQLYLVQESTSSGRSADEEYQRTIGAFYAIYWLARVSVDGRAGFALGVDQTWSVMPVDTDKPLREAWEKRMNFYTKSSWEYFECLLEDADVLMRDTAGGLIPNEARMLALLALTAMHDIMKVSELLPEVQKEHAPFQGYGAGDKIQDHDLAIAYVMEHYSELLPSFSGLDPEERFAIQFTQAKIAFNHGWFVQAEAPPGATFSKFRELLVNQSQSKFPVKKEDIALYFVHWITDLAGAEPTPLAGCEKFVVKFPLAVLNSFLRSFEFVERLGASTETTVMEQYLKVRWDEQTPARGAPPTGASGIAKMRLLCMAQSNAPAILDAFEELSRPDHEVLCREMARTGCDRQNYSEEYIPEDVHAHPRGPAFLIYYGPGLLQNLYTDTPRQRLSLLAEVYRQARVVWPSSSEKRGLGVTVRVDALKGKGCAELREAVVKEGKRYLLVKVNDSEGVVELKTAEEAQVVNSPQEGIEISIPEF
mmetsp:Transcript_17245/g.38756  ORF Transcript_17245/g.38756 Transcript_17245/m.38756 type:complete len:864 (-) Transcript_17245:30-2621(-)